MNFIRIRWQIINLKDVNINNETRCVCDFDRILRNCELCRRNAYPEDWYTFMLCYVWEVKQLEYFPGDTGNSLMCFYPRPHNQGLELFCCFLIMLFNQFSTVLHIFNAIHRDHDVQLMQITDVLYWPVSGS